MKVAARLARWMVVGSGILLLFWVAATIGAWSADIRKLANSVHGPMVADYRAESPEKLTPLSPAITNEASQDEASAGRARPRPTPSGPSPSAPGSGPTPTGSGVLPTLPVATPTLPVATPTLPVATPTVPVAPPSVPLATPTPPTLNPLPTPTVPTPSPPF